MGMRGSETAGVKGWYVSPTVGQVVNQNRLKLLLQLPVLLATHTGAQLTALRFDDSGLQLAAGTSTGITGLWDLRQKTPLLVKDHMYGAAITDIKFHSGSAGVGGGGSALDVKRIISTDKHIVKVSSLLALGLPPSNDMYCTVAIAWRRVTVHAWPAVCRYLAMLLTCLAVPGIRNGSVGPQW